MMAARKKQAEGATGTVQARRAAEAEREAEARRVRAELVKETKAEQAATAKFLQAKPVDSRTMPRAQPE
jgi:spore germination cell wall hydrolase CwlJ-like protein